MVGTEAVEKNETHVLLNSERSPQSLARFLDG
jgi:hypothetical protein